MYFGRGPNKIKDLHTLKDVYSFYIESVGSNEIYKVEFKVFKSIIEEYYLQVVDDILYKGREYKLPYRLGRIKIVKRKVDVNNLNRFGIDWVESVKNKKQIYHLNNHSRGFVYRYKWEKTNSLVPNLYFYKFVPTRTIKRKLAYIIKHNECDYYEK
jgi:hypothetical protein